MHYTVFHGMGPILAQQTWIPHKLFDYMAIGFVYVWPIFIQTQNNFGG